MKKHFLVLSLIFLAAGCTPNGKLIKVDVPNNCPGGGSGLSYTPVWYGDSYLAAFEITQVAHGSKWIFRLEPQTSATDPAGVDYESVEVSIIAKLPANESWLKAENKTYATGSEFHICVPLDQSQVHVDGNGFLEYEVIVEQVGTLDPRAVVMD